MFSFNYHLAQRMKKFNPIFSNPTFKYINKHQQQLLNTFKLFNTNQFQNILNNQKELQQTLKLFKPIKPQYYSGIIQKSIPNFYRFKDFQNLHPFNPYFKYINKTRSQIQSLHQINTLKKIYKNTKNYIGIPGNNYTSNQFNNNQKVQENIEVLSNTSINKIIKKTANETAVKVRKEDNERLNNTQRYIQYTHNYNLSSSHNWLTYIIVTIELINQIDSSCHTINDVINLINKNPNLITDITNIFIKIFNIIFHN